MCQGKLTCCLVFIHVLSGHFGYKIVLPQRIGSYWKERMSSDPGKTETLNSARAGMQKELELVTVCLP